MDERAAAAIRAALECLPAECSYHGTAIEPGSGRLYGREACCDTGRPAMRRRQAEQALERMVAHGAR
ncbi:hypothetical protein [Nonomuraea ceibae]|uniref:hypothetical protein n=1 Tax=Nonomuraea ceibae TaxID=1935170 RepID=UPI001C603D1C|nr:hypothetical protein [Nonomuraea ceibae]